MKDPRSHNRHHCFSSTFFAKTGRNRQADVIIDVFNTSIDSAVEQAKTLTTSLFEIAGVKPSGEMDYEALKAKVDRLVSEQHVEQGGWSVVWWRQRTGNKVNSTLARMRQEILSKIEISKRLVPE